MFGRNGEPVHRYTMRQAIEEGFILDVLRNYTTYATYYQLLKASEDDPEVERKEAARALARFTRLHPHNIAKKTEDGHREEVDAGCGSRAPGPRGLSELL